MMRASKLYNYVKCQVDNNSSFVSRNKVPHVTISFFLPFTYGNSDIFPSKLYWLVAWRKFSLRNVDNHLPVGRLRHGIVSLFLFVTPWPPRFPSGAQSVSLPFYFCKNIYSEPS